jgi:lipopolysaccharide/colanic/teichoic acid biosynthesis glycosyltransferase
VLPWEEKLFKLWHRVRFMVRPGITGLWQVTRRNALTKEQALDVDVDYVRRRNLGLDLVILLRTIVSALFSRPKGN